ncbi:MAG: thiamine phosphate synthase [Rhodobacteraceae bacterium]|nr:thiamine phosphate synthase [Paracoccaceae bacterium]
MKNRLDPFYLIVGNVELLERLLPLGVRLVQLRVKDKSEVELNRQIARARDLCVAQGAQLVVNDHWRIALDLGGDFVHLGQEDLDSADIPAIRRAGMRLGISTHDEQELERALRCEPAYVALGPIYPTLLKKMKWGPQGLDRVREWKRHAGKTPLVGIGGLTPERLPGLFAAGADSAAVVTDIQAAPDPESRCRAWIAATEDKRASL